jgi:hypothetical protein
MLGTPEPDKTLVIVGSDHIVQDERLQQGNAGLARKVSRAGGLRPRIGRGFRALRIGGTISADTSKLTIRPRLEG